MSAEPGEDHKLGWDPFAAVTVAQGGSTAYMLGSLTDPATWIFEPPASISLNGGTNDVRSGRTTSQQFAADQIANVDRLLGTGAKVVVAMIPPVADAAMSKRVRSFNQALLRVLGSRPVGVIDLAPTLAPHGVLEKRFTVDGVHFTKQAYDVWARQLRRCFADRRTCRVERLSAK